MLQALPSTLAESAKNRLALLLNHVISAEPVAMARLRPHSGAMVRVTPRGWPSLLPILPEAAFRITPAGLLEWLGPDESTGAADLEVEVEASNPLAALGSFITGARPRVAVAGSAALAADVNWLIDNLRWDVQDDLGRIIGPAPAHAAAQLVRAAAAALGNAVRTVGGVAHRGRSGDAGVPPAR